MLFRSIAFLGKLPFFLLGIGDDLFELGALACSRFFQYGNALFSASTLQTTFCLLDLSVLDMLFAELYFQVLHFDFLIQGLGFAVVLYIIKLLLVLLTEVACFFLAFVFLFNKGVDAVDLRIDIGNTRLEAGDLVFEVFYLHRQLAFQCFDFVTFGINFLERKECNQLFLY